MESSKKPPQPEEGSPALAPPPSFGIAESSGGHLLPMPTAMRDILGDADVDFDDLTDPSVDGRAKDGLESTHEQSGDDVTFERHADPRAKSSSKWVMAALVGALGVVAAAWFSVGDGSGERNVTADARDAQAPELPAAEAGMAEHEAEPVAPPSQPSASVEQEIAAANDLQKMEELSFDERHAVLARIEAAGRTSDVDLDLHVALDLVQAEESSDPCRTFGDALSLVESAADRTMFSATLASLEAPPQTSAGTPCPGQAQRLETLKRSLDEVEATPSAAVVQPLAVTTDRRRARVRRRNRDRDRDPASSAEADAVTPVDQNPPDPAPAKKNNTDTARDVASVLDDGLRPMGD